MTPDDADDFDLGKTVDRETVGREAAAPSEGPQDPLVGRYLGEYVIRRVVGRGGMGSVYEGFHVHLHKSVAIKVLASHLLDDPRAVERFRREMRAIGMINSPYIVQALDARLTGEIHYLAMEYVDGFDADELVRRMHGLPVNDACEIIRQAALGLEDVRRHDLVHRDIKPKNIAVSSAGKVKVLDLGLALCKSEILASGRLTNNAAIGSYQYMAPEQFDDSHDVDIRADLYSLGCTFFHLLTGHPPFSGTRYRTLTSLMDAHRLIKPPPIKEFNGMVTEELSEILHRLLAKNPEDRISTPGELAEMITPYAEHANLTSLVAMARETDTGMQTEIPTAGASPATKAPRAMLADVGPISLPSSVPTQPSPRRRRGMGWWWLAVAAGLVSALVSVAGWVEYRQRQLKIDRDELAKLVQVLPGLNGNWWLEETPWLLPPVREAMAVALASHTTTDDPDRPKVVIDPELIQQVKESTRSMDVDQLQSHWNRLADRLATDFEPAIRDAFFFMQREDPEAIDDAKLRGKLTTITEWFAATDDIVLPSTKHLEAVVLHKLGRFDDAEKAYQEGLKAYDSLDSTAFLESLCSADYGELLYAMGRYDDAALRFRVAAKLRGTPPAEFLLYVRCREADCLRKTPDGVKSAREAIELAHLPAAALPADHPLVAFLQEREGWLELDDWQVTRAAAVFEEVIRRRQKAVEARNRRAQFFLFFDRQGLAMAERLRGRREVSAKMLTELANDVGRSLAESQRYSAKQRSELKSRFLNVKERQADIALFGQTDMSPAIRALEEAIEFADREASEDGRLSRHVDRIRYKLAIVEASMGKDDVAETTLARAAGRGLTDLEVGYRDLAKISVRLDRKDAGAADQLGAMILSRAVDQTTRDDVELFFLACRLYDRIDEVDGPQAVSVLRREAQMAQSITLRGDDLAMLAYLRFHYDGMVRRGAFLSEFPAKELARIMLDARRLRLPSDSSDGLVYYFLENEGFVVDLDAEGSAVTVPLPFGWREIEAGRSDRARREEWLAKIPEPVRRELSSLRPEVVYFEDPVIGLTPADIATALP